jgi:hypothetical protein
MSCSSQHCLFGNIISCWRWENKWSTSCVLMSINDVRGVIGQSCPCESVSVIHISFSHVASQWWVSWQNDEHQVIWLKVMSWQTWLKKMNIKRHDWKSCQTTHDWRHMTVRHMTDDTWLTTHDCHQVTWLKVMSWQTWLKKMNIKRQSCVVSHVSYMSICLRLLHMSICLRLLCRPTTVCLYVYVYYIH